MRLFIAVYVSLKLFMRVLLCCVALRPEDLEKLNATAARDNQPAEKPLSLSDMPKEEKEIEYRYELTPECTLPTGVAWSLTLKQNNDILCKSLRPADGEKFSKMLLAPTNAMVKFYLASVEAKGQPAVSSGVEVPFATDVPQTTVQFPFEGGAEKKGNNKERERECVCA